VNSTPSVQTDARVGGFLFLVIIAAAIFTGIFVRSKRTVAGDASGAVDRILVSGFLFRSGIAAGVSLALWMMIKRVDLQKWRSSDDGQALGPAQ
jgi:hypothetical protein